MILTLNIKLLLITLIFLTACTNRELYQAGQEYQKSECFKNASSEEQFNDCLTPNKKAYEIYEQEREEIINQ